MKNKLLLWSVKLKFKRQMKENVKIKTLYKNLLACKVGWQISTVGGSVWGWNFSISSSCGLQGKIW